MPKGKNMSLADFLGDSYDDNNSLPTSSTGKTREEAREERQYGGDRRGGGRGRYGDDDDRPPSKADENTQWRRAGGGGSSFGGGGRGFGGGNRSGYNISNPNDVEAADNWRRGKPSSSSSGGGSPSGGDSGGRWRSSRAGGTGERMMDPRGPGGRGGDRGSDRFDNRDRRGGGGFGDRDRRGFRGGDDGDRPPRNRFDNDDDRRWRRSDNMPPPEPDSGYSNRGGRGHRGGDRDFRFNAGGAGGRWQRGGRDRARSRSRSASRSRSRSRSKERTTGGGGRDRDREGSAGGPRRFGRDRVLSGGDRGDNPPPRRWNRGPDRDRDNNDRRLRGSNDRWNDHRRDNRRDRDSRDTSDAPRPPVSDRFARDKLDAPLTSAKKDDDKDTDNSNNNSPGGNDVDGDAKQDGDSNVQGNNDLDSSSQPTEDPKDPFGGAASGRKPCEGAALEPIRPKRKPKADGEAAPSGVYRPPRSRMSDRDSSSGGRGDRDRFNRFDDDRRDDRRPTGPGSRRDGPNFDQDPPLSAGAASTDAPTPLPSSSAPALPTNSLWSRRPASSWADKSSPSTSTSTSVPSSSSSSSSSGDARNFDAGAAQKTLEIDQHEPEIDLDARARASELEAKKAIALAELQTSLDKALESKTTVVIDDITDNLGKLNLSDEDVESGLAACLAKSLYQKKLGLQELVDILGKEIPDDRANIVITTLQKITSLEGEPAMVELVHNSKCPILPVIAPGQEEGPELDQFLIEKKLLQVKPVRNIKDDVEAAIAAEAKSDEILKLINDNVGVNIAVGYLVETVGKSVLDRVFADRKNPKLEILEENAKLLARCVAFDSVAEVKFVFLAQEAWYTKNKKAPTVKQMFKDLFNLDIVSRDGFMGWKEDLKTKSKGKPQTLIKVNSWLNELAPKRSLDDEVDGADDNADNQDAYLDNPNAEFFK